MVLTSPIRIRVIPQRKMRIRVVPRLIPTDGQDGPPNELSIGTVETGETAAASITGESPSQTLNLVLPKGDKGDKGDKGEQGPPGDVGPAGTITGATATGLAAGAAPTVTLGGTPQARTFAFGIPKGDKGDIGPKGDTGDQGIPGADGADGNDGWTPVFAVVDDGARRVQQVSDWIGGTGAKPATGQYVGPAGFVSAIGDAVDIRGASGSGTGDVVGPAGSVDGEMALFDGVTGKLIKGGGAPFSGSYSDLSDKPTLGTAAAANTGDFATAAQGVKADTAVQPSDLGSAAGADVGDFATAAQGENADAAFRFIRQLNAAGEDLDAVVDVGWYSMNTNAGATAGTNYPVPQAGVLQVIPSPANNIDVIQRYTTYRSNGGVVYQRVRSSAGSVIWGAWKREVTDDMIVTTSADGLMSAADKAKLNGITVPHFNTMAEAEAGYKPVVLPEVILVEGFQVVSDEGHSLWHKKAPSDPTFQIEVPLTDLAGNSATYTLKSRRLNAGALGLDTTGATDVANYLQICINQVSALGGGTVYLPGGRYKLGNQLVLKRGVTLEGDGGNFIEGDPDTAFGTIIDIQFGSGSGAVDDIAKAGILVENCTTIRNLLIDHSEQNLDAATPTEYGPAIAAYEDNTDTYLGDITIHNVNFVRPYCALDFRGDDRPNTKNMVRIHVTDCTASFLAYGIRANNITDWSRFTRFTAQPGKLSSDTANNARNWANENGVVYDIGDADWLLVEGGGAWAYRVGAALSGVGPITFIGCQFDAMSYADVQMFTCSQLKFSACTFTAFDAYDYETNNDPDTAKHHAFFLEAGHKVDGLTIQGCEAFGPLDTLIWGYYTGATVGQMDNVTVCDNRVRTLATNKNRALCVVNRGDNFRVYNNDCNDNYGYTFETPNELTHSVDSGNVYATT